MGRECFEALPEEELLQIYDIHQQDLIERLKKKITLYEREICEILKNCIIGERWLDDSLLRTNKMLEGTLYHY